MALFDRYMTRQKQQELKGKYMHNIMYGVSEFIYKTSINKYYISDYAKNNPFIACLWHGNFLMMPYLYAKARKTPNMSLLTSSHGDGVMVERYFEKFGLHAIRGSTGIEKGGTKALIKAIKELKAGRDIAITPDGPKGPYKSIANGILLMAIKSGIGICGCRVKPKRYWQLKTWDKFCIPKPFNSIKYYIADPIFFPKDIEIEKAKAMLESHMQELDSL